MSTEVAFEIRDAFPPGTVEEILVQYLSGLFEDPDEEPDDIMQVMQDMLESAVDGHEKELQVLLEQLRTEIQSKTSVASRQQRPALLRLDNVVDMSKAGALSNTIGFSEGVDLSSINKGK